ncbi:MULTISPECIES: hypothetical protein [Yersinia pseudotuberculosis complex]|uniref:HEAT repeat domain-containing protein n=1 Tax=Yersinia pseudotuberculosis serotype O:1b (strain IP 31758) TaxID=349747 RepID=A0A0U1QYZ2_YERP3|nr:MULTISPECIES: hypothetical protein [Yersinia pseudotuberculosis complex]ABS47980.1 hypothetical protein YpsIP31758_0703 [Yersinia pseudotuberculosis IP 31758]AJK17170.1 hypothetical protein BZ19_2680 [Yersinia pseudotuberculosis str. PA3606]MCE4114582.1 hypothetical protein [Yersinia pseudotuberculosis]MCF1165134.1 hypothetical protein [Yersinia pseudotuberculosis]RYC20211.1 hypothetical protein EU971_19445 [Yersinia pseudotuberculosis]
MMNIYRQKLDEEILALDNVESLSVIFNAFKQYCGDLVATRTGISIKGVDGAPDWYGYERVIWDSSYVLLEPILKKYCGENALLDGISSMCTEKKHGKGRQSFVMLLDKYGSTKYLPILAKLIDDPEVAIHSIEALTKLKDLSQFEKIKKLSECTKSTPIKSYARRYIKKLSNNK